MVSDGEISGYFAIEWLELDRTRRSSNGTGIKTVIEPLYRHIPAPTPTTLKWRKDIRM